VPLVYNTEVWVVSVFLPRNAL